MKRRNSFFQFLTFFKFLSLRNSKIGYKFLTAFFISVLLFAVATTVVFLQLSSAKTNVSDINKKSQLTIDLGKLALLIEEKDALVANYIIVNSDSYVEEYKEGQEKLNDLINRLETHYKIEENNYFEHIRTIISEMDDLFLNDVIESDDDHAQLMYVIGEIRNQKSSAVRSEERRVGKECGVVR